MKKMMLFVLMVLFCAQFVSAGTKIQITNSAMNHWDGRTADGQSTFVFGCGSALCTGTRGTLGETQIDASNIWYGHDININGDIVHTKNAAGTYQIFQYGLGQLTTDSGDKTYLDMCPDGNTVVYCGYDGSYFQVYKKTLGSAGAGTVLTSNSFDACWYGYSDWLDCGNTHVVFSADDGGGYPHIYKVSLSGGASTQLTTGSYEDWSPQWSPDYTKIAFSSNEYGDYDIFTINADGTGRTVHTTGSVDNQAPFYCPNGNLYSVVENGANTDLQQVLPTQTTLYADVYWGLQDCSSGSYDILFTQYDSVSGYNQEFQDHNDDGPSNPVPEFSSITLLLAALVALGGIFAFRRFR